MGFLLPSTQLYSPAPKTNPTVALETGIIVVPSGEIIGSPIMVFELDIDLICVNVSSMIDFTLLC